jgi:hypothetical protein
MSLFPICSVTNTEWAIALSLLDISAAFFIVGLMVQTTKHASWYSFFHGEPQGRWAMIRRLVYCFVAWALFTRAMIILDPRLDEAWLEFVTSVIILGSLIFFPAMRAFGFIDEDRLVEPAQRKRERALSR